MKPFLSFLFSKSFLIQLIIAVVILIVGCMVVLRAIANYTKHGETYEVPSLHGETIADAETLLESNKMHLVIADSLFVDDAKPGTILEQIPQAGQQVKEGRKVFATISASNPDQIIMPQLTDISFRQALSIIQACDLRIGDISYRSSEYEDLVLEQQLYGEKIPAGKPVSKGSYIALVVGKRGAVGKTTVPQLAGACLEACQMKLSSKRLNLGAVLYDGTVITAEDSAQAQVVRQKPAAESNIDLGGLVDIWLSTDSDQVPIARELDVQ